MPRGYYLGQGLIPLGEDSSDDDEGPCRLPNGRYVCGPHGLVTCHKCCSDYSFMDDVLAEDEELADEEDLEDDEDLDDDPHHDRDPGDEMVRGTGLVFPSKFRPQANSQPPLELFSGRKQHIAIVRYTHPNDDSILLLMTDGACLNNGKANPKAGWAFAQGLNLEGQPSVVTGALEKQGPWGDDGIQSNNRAELRAVIAALRFRHWAGEGFHTVVIATDSEYVVEGSTQWARSWVRNNWKTRGNNGGRIEDVKNKDLWEALLGEYERAQRYGLAIQFWRIPRQWNTLADEGAKKGAAEKDSPEKWQNVIGMAF